MLFSDQLSIRTVSEPVALCLLESNERSMLPFIGRPRRSSRLRSHRDTVCAILEILSYFKQLELRRGEHRVVWLPRDDGAELPVSLQLRRSPSFERSFRLARPGEDPTV
jgi:hypothetical protein